MEEKHTFKGIFDFTFRTQASRALAPIIYASLIILFVVNLGVTTFSVLQQGADLWKSILLIGYAVVLAILQIIVARFGMEAVLKLFEIAENTKKA